VGRAGSGLFRSIELRRCYESQGTCPLRAHVDAAGESAPAFRCIHFVGHDSAADYLRTYATDADQMMMFRRIAAEESHSVYRSSDHQVLETIASKITQHALCLIMPLPFESRPMAVAPPVPAPSASSAMTPSQYAPSPPSEPSEPAEPEFAELLDQTRQAETLILAARAGVPFCEECERRRAAGAV
jgi:hypothetical protein